MLNYIAVIHKEKGSDYGVSFPDFPGCITSGKTIDEAKDLASEALDLHVSGMIEDMFSIPDPTGLELINAKVEYRDAVAFFIVGINDSLGRKVRINATIDEKLLAKIDMVSKAQGKSRSAFLADSARQAIDHIQN